MKYSLALLIALISIQIGVSQNSQFWKGYFSYKQIKDISQSPTVFFAAAENALFSKIWKQIQLKPRILLTDFQVKLFHPFTTAQPLIKPLLVMKMA